MPGGEQAEQIIQEALQHHSRGNFRDAEIGYRRGLELDPNHSIALHYLGVLAHQAGQNDPAIQLMLRSIELQPNVSAYHNNLGEAYRAAGKIDDAEAQFLLSIEIDPNDYLAHNNLGVIATQRQQFDRARAHFNTSLAAVPQFVGAICNLANTFWLQQRLSESEAEYRRALEFEPKSPMAKRGLAGALAPLGRLDEAMRLIDEARAGAPNDPDVHLTRMELLIFTGRMREAWPEFEWRMQKYPVLQQNLPRPLWRGEPIDGKTILLYEEQGYGDAIQFARYIPLLAERGAKVIVYCRQELKALFESVAGVTSVLSGSAQPVFDIHCALPSLPGIFQTDLQTIPAAVPYIHPSESAIQRRRDRLAEFSGKRRIGLVWAGGAGAPHVVERSATLEQLAPLAGVDAIFFSLQKGAGAEQAQHPPTGMQLVDLSKELTDFADTAAAMANLDLIITVDTAAAHVAGAIGKKTWTMIPLVPTWRWLLDREDSPWYPTMKLWRQKNPGDWTEVATRMATALAATLEADSKSPRGSR